MTYYNSIDTCDKIKEDGKRCGRSFHGKAYAEKNINRDDTGKWICRTCYNKDYNDRLLKKLKEPPKPKGYTDKELLNYLIHFIKENRRVPVNNDFRNNPMYPSSETYRTHFGTWQNALKLVGLDTDMLVKNGILENETQKGRFAEIIVRDHFKKNPVDLSGNDFKSYCDGMCPNGQIYDVKSSKLHIGERNRWSFGTQNKDKGDDIEAIQWYYFVACNEDYTKILHIWRVPGEIVEGDIFYVGIDRGYKFNLENMKEYDITEKMTDIIKIFNREL